MTGLDRYLADPAFTNCGFVLVDFEGTTPAGMPPEPTEVGVVVLRPTSARPAAELEFEALIRPPAHAPLTPTDTRQTGITPSMLADRPPADLVLAQVDALLTTPPYVIVAHHAPTEAGILRRYAHACPTLAAAPVLDTLKLAKACYRGLDSYSLDSLLTHLHIPIPALRHRALPDARATAELFIRLLTDGAAVHGWSQLAQLRALAGLPPPAATSAQIALFSNVPVTSAWCRIHSSIGGPARRCRQARRVARHPNRGDPTQPEGDFMTDIEPGAAVTPVRVLMALDPPYYELMWHGKRHEFRRRFLPGRPVTWFAYLTEPVDALTAVIDLAPAIVAPAEQLADLAERATPGNRDAVYAYLKDQPHGYAMPILRVREFPPKSAADLADALGFFSRPRGFTLIDDDPRLAAVCDSLLATPPLREIVIPMPDSPQILAGSVARPPGDDGAAGDSR